MSLINQNTVMVTSSRDIPLIQYFHDASLSQRQPPTGCDNKNNCGSSRGWSCCCASNRGLRCPGCSGDWWCFERSSGCFQSLFDLVTTLRQRPNDSLIVVANIDFYGNYIDFGLPSQRVLSTPNAGGPSLVSEAMSAEVVDRLVDIRQLLTELEVQYKTKGPITDYACYSASTSQALGVSVTRAMAFARRFTSKDAMRLMKKKLRGINKSTISVSNYKFDRQILHVWAANGTDAAIVRRACSKIPSHIRSNTIILITTINMGSVFGSV